MCCVSYRSLFIYTKPVIIQMYIGVDDAVASVAAGGMAISPTTL